MRGFSMIIVVLGHVLMSMDLGGYSSLLSSVLLTFRMPLFFFISGFFSYRLIEWWTKARLADILKRKVQAQIISTIIFVSLFDYIISGRISWFRFGFGGYWFTIVLFQMYVLYLLSTLVSRIIQRDISIKLMIVGAIIALGVLILWRPSQYWIWNFLCLENFTKYLQFFAVGLICAKYKSKFLSFIINRRNLTVFIVGWFICMLLWYNDNFKSFSPLAYSCVHDIMVRYFALFTVVALFGISAEYFSGESRTAKLLQFIGSRTLDIYMIHYLLLISLQMPLLISGDNIIIQMLVSGVLTIAIVAVCLFISGIIRKSPFLASWLFGVKKNEQDKVEIISSPSTVLDNQ